LYRSLNPYVKFSPSSDKSVQENAGYSDRPEINEVLDKSAHDLLTAIGKYCKPGDRLLDVGCGPGYYIDRLPRGLYNVTASDLNPGMLDIVKKNHSDVEVVAGNFLDAPVAGHFRFIYCIGLLVYVPVPMLKGFIRRVNDLLEPGGVFYLNYPHALSRFHVLMPDPAYVQYSPEVIEKEIEPYFHLVHHAHAVDGRVVRSFDRRPYKSLNPATNRTYKNSYLLIARKK
jgi:SAM-dependent methyltransferase